MNSRLLLTPVLLVALSGLLAHTDLSETRKDIKRGTKGAARKTDHVTEEARHTTANVVRAVGHGAKGAMHTTKYRAKHVFREPCESG